MLLPLGTVVSFTGIENGQHSIAHVQSTENREGNHAIRVEKPSRCYFNQVIKADTNQ